MLGGDRAVRTGNMACSGGTVHVPATAGGGLQWGQGLEGAALERYTLQ